MRCCQNKTSLSWSYRDSSKRSLENNVISRWGREKYTHFEIGGHVQIAKSDLEAQRKSSLSDCTWLEKLVWILNLKLLRFLMHSRELGSSLYFIFITSYIYIYIYISFLLLFLSFFFHHFFICSPWTLNCVAPTSSPMLRRLLILGQRGDRDKVGTIKNFPLERHLKPSILEPSCDLPWIDDVYSMTGCGQEGNHKRWYFWF
jgi:hypothetical protein